MAPNLLGVAAVLVAAAAVAVVLQTARREPSAGSSAGGDKQSLVDVRAALGAAGALAAAQRPLAAELLLARVHRACSDAAGSAGSTGDCDGLQGRVRLALRLGEASVGIILSALRQFLARRVRCSKPMRIRTQRPVVASWTTR
eukprot:m.189432 g.189432  ORF g.189432 m.189432 type:complete len:143 (+) comp10567_c2_seq1:171-599(+)